MRYLQTAVEGAMALENPEEESEGYLLEKGLKDSLVDLRAAVLGLLKIGPVGPDAEGGAADEEAGEKPAN